MIRRVNTQYSALVFFFTLCQVVGMMCALPDLSVAEETAILVSEGMVCPMEGMNMCPPALISSPERHMKDSLGADVDHAPILLSAAAMLTVPSAWMLWSWSSDFSLALLSISSSAVLRI